MQEQTETRSFDLAAFKQSLLNVLLTGVRAITGGIIALKGQLVRVKGRLLSAKGNIISASGEALSQFGRNIASNALSPKPPDAPGQNQAALSAAKFTTDPTRDYILWHFN